MVPRRSSTPDPRCTPIPGGERRRRRLEDVRRARARRMERWNGYKRSSRGSTRKKPHDGRVHRLSQFSRRHGPLIIDPEGLDVLFFQFWDEGNLDPNGATRAYLASRKRGADLVEQLLSRCLARRDRAGPGRARALLSLMPAGSTDWPDGRGVDHPLVPIPHHYLATDDVPEVAAVAVTDLEGFTYLCNVRQLCFARRVRAEPPPRWEVDRAPWTSAGRCSRRARPNYAQLLQFRAPPVPRAGGDRGN